MLIQTLAAAGGANGAARVILVSPEPRVRQRLGNLLRAECVQVIEAASVDGALAAARAHQPTVIATDLVLEREPLAGLRLATEAKHVDPCIQTVIFLDVDPSEDIRRRTKLAAVLVVQLTDHVSALLSAVRAAHDTYRALAAPRRSAAGRP